MKRKHFITLGHVLKHSIVPYDDYYGKVLHNTPFRFSLKYFFTLSILLILLEFVSAFIGVGKAYPFFKMDTGIRSIVEQIPDDLVVNLQSGQLTTNYDRPTIIFNPDMATPGTLMVIDQNADKNKIFEYETQVLFTGHELITNIDGRVMSFEYGVKKLESGMNSLALGRLSRASTPMIMSVYVIAILLLPLLITVGRLIVLYAISLLVFLLCFKIIPRLKINKVFQISLHAVTAPLIIQSVLSILGLTVPLEFWWFNAMTIIFLLAALYEAYILSSRTS
ncbi:DUF1189 family protein [Candidatus Woesebacteria bacterium]|nr:DUF1189 family protein [Candidatus Woesebacteria bacterium]